MDIKSKKAPKIHRLLGKALSEKRWFTYKVLTALMTKLKCGDQVTEGETSVNLKWGLVLFQFSFNRYICISSCKATFVLENSTSRSRGATAEALKSSCSLLGTHSTWHGAVRNMFRPIPKQRVETTSPGNTGTAPVASDGSYVPSSGAEGLATACCQRNR